MKLKAITLNIWRYYEWEKRKQKVLKFLKNEDADILFLQEVASSEKADWENQVEEINQELGYLSASYFNMAKMDKWHEESLDYEMHYGLGIISKYKIKESEFVKVKPVLKEKDFGFLHVVIETPEGDLDLLSVHYENTDEGAKAQLKETLEWCKEKKIKPIIAGDFNMKLTENLKELAEEDYEISYLIKPYKSFMPTEHSHNPKPITLDYVIAHKMKFKIEEVECIHNDSSDHDPVIAKLSLI